MVRTVGQASTRAIAAIVTVIGADELLIAVALGCGTSAIWPLVGRLALLVPCVVLLWIALPSRTPFITRPPAEKPMRRDK